MSEMKKEIALVCMLFVGVISFGQTLKLDWSEDLQYDKKEGFLDEIIGTNENKIFTIFNIAKPGITTTELTIKKIQLVAFDKKSLKKTQSVPVMGYPSNKESDKNLKGLEYFKTVFTNNSIYIFWQTEKYANIGKRELYAQTFDLSLKPTNQLKKVIEVIEPKKVDQSSKFFISNSSSQNKIVVIYDLPGMENENRVISLSYLNSDLTLGKTHKLTLSKKIKKSSYSIYNYNLYDNDLISISNYSEDIFFNLKDGKQKANNITLPDDLKVISKISNKEGNFKKNYGIYSDKELFGVFYYTENTEDFTISKIEKIPFSKEQTESLISNYKNEYNKLAQNQRFSAVEAKDIAKNYQIEKAIEDSTGIYLIASRSYNYYMVEPYRTGGATSYANIYYSDKGTIAVIPLINNKIGKITTIARNITYRNEWKAYDVSCIKSKNQLYFIYGSDFNVEKKNIIMNSTKYYFKMTYPDKIAYSIYDFKNQIVSNKSIVINDEKSDKIQKYVAPAKFISFNSNEYLINSNNMYNGFGIRKKKGQGNIGILRVE